MHKLCQLSPPIVTASLRLAKTFSFVLLLSVRPPRSSGDTGLGLRRTVSAAQPRVGVHLGSARFSFSKGEAVDLKRHFKGSSILI
jgi:hypothetical protein